LIWEKLRKTKRNKGEQRIMLNKTEKYVVIVGCGRLGGHLANMLGEGKNNSIVVIDKNEEAFERLNASFSGFTIEANALEIEVLKQAKIASADVVVTTTNNDNVNIMVAQIAKSIFGVNQVIARLTDPSKEKVYSELNIETISPTELSAIEFQRIILRN